MAWLKTETSNLVMKSVLCMTDLCVCVRTHAHVHECMCAKKIMTNSSQSTLKYLMQNIHYRLEMYKI